MSLSRRDFARTLGLGGAGILSADFIAGRGYEAAVGDGPAIAAARAACRGRHCHQQQRKPARSGRVSAGGVARARQLSNGPVPGQRRHARRHDCEDARRQGGERADRDRVGPAPRSRGEGLRVGLEGARQRHAVVFVARSDRESDQGRRQARADREGVARARSGRDGGCLEGRRPRVRVQPEQSNGDDRSGLGDCRLRQEGSRGIADDGDPHRRGVHRLRRRSQGHRGAAGAQYPDVFITRTFSKAYGMAGLRLGYAIGQPATLKKLSDAWGLGSVNVITAAAAVAALKDTAHMDAERAENKKLRDYTIAGFKDMGVTGSVSNTNFVFLNIGRPAGEFREACAKRNVIVARDFPPMAKTHARITIGTAEEMKKAMDVFREVLGTRSTAAPRSKHSWRRALALRIRGL